MLRYMCVCVNCLGSQVGRAFAEGWDFEPRLGQVKDLEIGTCDFHGYRFAESRAD